MSGLVLLILRFALAGILFGFLGWALWVIWHDLHEKAPKTLSGKRPTLVLEREIDEQITAYRFSSPDVVIGRDPACELSLDDSTISARHTRLAYHHSQWWVEDLRSRNGTYLNHEPISDPVVVTSGDVLRCGQVILQLAIEAIETDTR